MTWDTVLGSSGCLGRDAFGTILDIFFDDFGMILGRFRDDFGPFRAPFWGPAAVPGGVRTSPEALRVPLGARVAKYPPQSG